MMDGIIPAGRHHLGHGDHQLLGLHLHPQPGTSGAQTKRVSVLIGNHQPIGTQTKRVGVLIGSHQVPGSRHSHGSEDRPFTRAFMTTKITSVCDG